MSDYTLTQQEFRRLKQRLSYRVNILKKKEQAFREARPVPTAEQRKELLYAAGQVVSECAYA